MKLFSGLIEYPTFRSPVTLALKLAGGMKITAPLSFKSGETPYHLGCWTGTGLTYYAGSASYEKAFRLAPELQNYDILLDLGSVGVAAEVWVNGEKAGERIWEPFSVEITRFLKPGENRLKITVTNMSDALRTQPDRPQAIDMNGLMGPVRLVPYRKSQFVIHV